MVVSVIVADGSEAGSIGGESQTGQTRPVEQIAARQFGGNMLSVGGAATVAEEKDGATIANRSGDSSGNIAQKSHEFCVVGEMALHGDTFFNAIDDQAFQSWFHERASRWTVYDGDWNVAQLMELSDFGPIPGLSAGVEKPIPLEYRGSFGVSCGEESTRSTISTLVKNGYFVEAGNFSVSMVIRSLLLLLALGPLIYYLLSLYDVVEYFRSVRRLPPRNDALTPTVSILKPVRGMDSEAYENFASY